MGNTKSRAYPILHYLFINKERLNAQNPRQCKVLGKGLLYTILPCITRDCFRYSNSKSPDQMTATLSLHQRSSSSLFINKGKKIIKIEILVGYFNIIIGILKIIINIVGVF